MPFSVKSTSITFSVLCFFVTAMIAGLNNVSPIVCCKRSVIAAAISYATTACVVKIVNSIIISAMVKSQMEKQQENNI